MMESSPHRTTTCSPAWCIGMPPLEDPVMAPLCTTAALALSGTILGVDGQITDFTARPHGVRGHPAASARHPGYGLPDP